jgi:hypothetical protein
VSEHRIVVAYRLRVTQSSPLVETETVWSSCRYIATICGWSAEKVPLILRSSISGSYSDLMHIVPVEFLGNVAKWGVPKHQCSLTPYHDV